MNASWKSQHPPAPTTGSTLALKSCKLMQHVIQNLTKNPKDKSTQLTTGIALPSTYLPFVSSSGISTSDRAEYGGQSDAHVPLHAPVGWYI